MDADQTIALHSVPPFDCLTLKCCFLIFVCLPALNIKYMSLIKKINFLLLKFIATPNVTSLMNISHLLMEKFQAHYNGQTYFFVSEWKFQLLALPSLSIIVHLWLKEIHLGNNFNWMLVKIPINRDREKNTFHCEHPLNWFAFDDFVTIKKRLLWIAMNRLTSCD